MARRAGRRRPSEPSIVVIVRTETAEGRAAPARSQVLWLGAGGSAREGLRRGLEARGFRVSVAEVRPDPAAPRADLVIVDLGSRDPTEALSLARMRGTTRRAPAIVVGDANDPDAAARCLDAGADDYVCLPVSVEELAARIRARLRDRWSDLGVPEVGGTRLDPIGRRAVQRDREIELSPREAELLAALMRRAGRVVSRSQLLRWVWRLRHDPGSNVVTVHIAALRRKLDPGSIETVRGIGYRFVGSARGSA